MAGTHYAIPYAVFSYDHHPSEPREVYASGDLGIVIPTYARVYLYAAFRWMSGAAITPAERQAIGEVWSDAPRHASAYRAPTWSRSAAPDGGAKEAT